MARGPTHSPEHLGHRGSRRRPARAGLSIGLAVSAVAHVALLLLYPSLAPEISSWHLPVALGPTSEPAGTRVLRIVEVEGPEVVSPDGPVDLEVEDLHVDRPESPRLEEDGGAALPRWTPAQSALERLRISEGGDPRLWQPLDPDLIGPSPEQIMALRVAIAIEAAADSAVARAEEARRSLDWSYTDEEGGRWGVSPGKLHLGDLTIPLPFGFGPPPDVNGDRAEMAFRTADVDRAASTLAVRRSWEERREAMMKRREELRALKGEEKDAGEQGDGGARAIEAERSDTISIPEPGC
ncbi:MAG: hypothetical protein J4F34_04330 [Gemmatimonadetes bacterium]|nr:hypothetical protein [Gemmatimonadota bacterium]